jgi:hypothetical protein
MLPQHELRKTQMGFWNGLADFRDNLFHSIKIPTKVLIGLVLASPFELGIMKFPPVRDLLMPLPPISNTIVTKILRTKMKILDS